MKRLALLLLLLPLLALAAGARETDPATNAVDLVEETLAEPRHAILGIGGGIDDSRWAWPGEDVVVDGVVFAFGLSLFDTHNGVGLGLGAQWADESLNGVHLSLVQHDASAMRGVQIAGILNTGARSEGLQIAGLANFVREGAGVQLSLFGNANCALVPPRDESSRDYYEWFDANEFAGVQLAGLVNVASCLEGVQVAGLINRSDGYHTDGLQLALGMNVSRRMRGVQAAALGNETESLNGLQLGLFNMVSNRLRGVQIGALNGTRAPGSAGAQIGLVNAGRGNLFQAGLLNVGNGRSAQAGFLNWSDGDGALLQVGAVNVLRHADSGTHVQIGALNIGCTGRAGQFGLVNVAHHSPLQVGLINVARGYSLQIGVVNWAEEGLQAGALNANGSACIPVFPIVNFGMKW